MEFIGRTVKKEFLGFGTVKSYDASSKFYKIVYGEGDTEEVELSELVSLFERAAGVELAQDKNSEELGLRLKKRRRTEPASGRSGNDGDDVVRDNVDLKGDVFDEDLDNGNESVGFKGNSAGGINLNIAVEEVMEGNLKDAVACNGHASGNPDPRVGLDLNSGLDLNESLGLNDGDNSGVNAAVNLVKSCGIDLNLDAINDLDENSRPVDGSERKDCLFDLNLGIDNETKDEDFDGKGQLVVTGSGQLEDNDEEIAIDVEVKFIDANIANGGLTGVDLDADELSSLRRASCSADCLFESTSVVSVEVIDGDTLHNGASSVLDGNDDCGYSSPQRECLCEHSDALDRANESALTSSYRRVSGRRKKRKAVDNLNSPEVVLRRSARRGASKIRTPDIVRPTAVSYLAPSPAVSAITEEKPEDTVRVPPKVELPPSSGALESEGISILDVFSVYSCLRSFSTLLFLSPFELEEFIVALRSKNPNSLIDCIHVSLLQTLRKHLEHLSSEGSLSAVNCLRSLKWDLLDLITWPMFLVEYLLLHSSAMQPCELSRLRLFRTNYYKQPVSVKIEILRCLCDEVVEAEVIRSELSARSLAADPDMEVDRTISVETTKRRRGAVGISDRTSLNVDADDDTADRNSDECCLCKMDGSLICCDGCPAAYHARCVGIASDLLPEGEWYCPECAIEKNNSGVRSRRSLRGAELLGIDPHGRVYYSCFGYLLVSDSHENEVCHRYYHKDDLGLVIEMLKSSELHYSTILKAIYKQWDLSLSFGGVTSDTEFLKYIAQAEKVFKMEHPAISLDPETLPCSAACVDAGEADDERILEKESVTGASVGFSSLKTVKNSTSGTENVYLSSEGSIEITTSSESEKRENNLASTKLVVNPERKESAALGNTCLTLNSQKEDELKEQNEIGYLNYYSFGRIAASVVEDLLQKSADKSNKDSFGSVEDIISSQIKVISKRLTKFHWPNEKNVDARREKCGWCFSCRTPTEDFDCLINMYVGSICQSSETDVSAVQLRKTDSHLTGVICGLLSTEERLRGLLLGPWLNSQYTQTWRRSVLMASDIESLKSLLLQLESDLHPRAISEEWIKYEDSASLLGSASLVVTNSLPTSSKAGSSRKRGRCSNLESNPSSSASSGPGMFWWRGGRVSRQLFSWKVVPRSLLCKAARQGGCRKIHGISYSENSDFARRSKKVAWQAAVETSATVAQFALQIRELDSNIKWDDMENIHSICKWDKEVRKSLKAFKKVIVRRKRLECDVPKYLLDFGKRRAIPEIVMKHGSMLEEGSSDRKRYWLNECFVPLHLLKNFEEKRIARVSSKVSSWKDAQAGSAEKKLLNKRSSVNISEADVSIAKPSTDKGFAYLFRRAAERVENYQCGHCKKGVLAGEAVSCHSCKGFFHKRHVIKSAGAITAECTYTCHQCRQGNSPSSTKKMGKAGGKVKGKVSKGNKKAKFIPESEIALEPQKHKKALGNRRLVKRRVGKIAAKGKKMVQSAKSDVVPAVPLRRSTRKAVKYMPVQKKIRRGRKKGRKKSQKGTPTKMKRVNSFQKQRAKVSHSYWLNGLLLSRTPDDERAMNFRDKGVLSPSGESRVRRNRVKCLLCREAAHTPTSNYISCESCRKWFHGDAFGLDADKLRKVMGFRCHVCRGRAPPGLPCRLALQNDGSPSADKTRSTLPSLSKANPTEESHFKVTSARELRVYRRAKESSDPLLENGVENRSSLKSSYTPAEDEEAQVIKKLKTSATQD